jgi:hypothetical protein
MSKANSFPEPCEICFVNLTFFPCILIPIWNFEPNSVTFGDNTHLVIESKLIRRLGTYRTSISDMGIQGNDLGIDAMGYQPSQKRNKRTSVERDNQSYIHLDNCHPGTAS